MQRLPGLLSGIALIFLIENTGYTNAWNTASNRAFLDPIDYSLGKKSCSDGYVHRIDNFIVTGFVNVTGYTLPKVPAKIVIWGHFVVVNFLAWYPAILLVHLQRDLHQTGERVPMAATKECLVSSFWSRLWSALLHQCFHVVNEHVDGTAGC